MAVAQIEPSVADKRTTAREKLVVGDGLLKRGEFQQALSTFKEAYDLYPSPKIHYNFGLAYQGMGRNADALEEFEKFLANATDAQEEVRAKAIAIREALLHKVGTLQLTVAVDGTVVIDGRELGKTPITREIRLEPGQHVLLLDRGQGAAPIMQRVELPAGASVTAILGPTSDQAARVAAARPATSEAPSDRRSSVESPAATTAFNPGSGNPGAELRPDLRSVSEPPNHDPIYRRPWFWAATAAAAAAVGLTLWLTVGRSNDYPSSTLGRMNLPLSGAP